MLENGSIFLLAMVYIAVLFLVASYGDRRRHTASASNKQPYIDRPVIYALSLAVYCTSWTFFGSVGLAARSGLEFLAIYIGPVMFVVLGHKLLKRIVQIAKAQRIASMADFIGARYGKSSAVAAVAASIAVIGTIPYIALQLKAVSSSLEYLVTQSSSTTSVGDISAFVAIAMAAFAMLFGTRHADATEHQDGMMLAIAMESLVKIAAFVGIGFFITYGVFGGFSDLLAAAEAKSIDTSKVMTISSWPRFFLLTCMSMGVFILLPRIFHVAVVESHSEKELKRAITLFPLYLVAINLFVVPIALAGLVQFGDTVDGDIFVLALPLTASEPFFAILAFLGGLSAATAMVIVATVALAIMISNDLVLPFLLRQKRGEETQAIAPSDMVVRILNVRRTSIFVVMFFAFIYYRSAGEAALAAIGLMSFAALLQMAPAFFGGLLWRRATARGAIAGMVTGFGVWCYTLLLPTLVETSSPLLADGPLGIGWLRPQGLLYIDVDPLLHGVVFSILANIAAYIIGSSMRAQNYLERVQGSIFIPRSTSSLIVRHRGVPISVREVRNTVARFLGHERTLRSFSSFFDDKPMLQVDQNAASPELLEFAEQLLASAIGTSSSRLVLSLMLQKHEPVGEETVQLLDDASVAIQYNRDLLQTALDKVEQGLTVFDGSDKLICWNNKFRGLLHLPPHLGEVGTSIEAIYEELHDRGDLVGVTFRTFKQKILSIGSPWNLNLKTSGQVFEIVSNAMPDGGVVTTYADITQSQHDAGELRAAKESLEQRVAERTAELTRLNKALAEAKSRADSANTSKTKFLAAAGHDILQPLNAARLYTSFLSERLENSIEKKTSDNLEMSLDAVEDILGAVLAISRLDSGHWTPEFSTFPMTSMLDQIRAEFTPIAADKNLQLKVVNSSLWVKADQKLLKRLLQNLVSNAIKYTETGGVVVGVRRTEGTISIQVHDSGIGISENDQPYIFQEFQRLPDGKQKANGLGLGLSIVERIAKGLSADVVLESELGKGSVFSISLPRSEAAVLEPKKPKNVQARSLGRTEGVLVLCIDNETKILEGMRTLLSNWGCHILIAEKLEQARFEIHKAGAYPDIILADYHLDEGDGLSCIDTLCKDAGTKLPAVLLTADRSAEMKERAAAQNVTVLNKPVKPAALRALIANVQVNAKAAE